MNTITKLMKNFMNYMGGSIITYVASAGDSDIYSQPSEFYGGEPVWSQS